MLTKYQYPIVGDLYGVADTRHRIYCEILGAVALAQGHPKAARVVTEFGRGPIDYSMWSRFMDEDRHETAGFIRYVRAKLPEFANHLYIGMTSSDLQDTFDALAWREYWDRLGQEVAELQVHWATTDAYWRIGRTHGRMTGEWVDTNSVYLRASRNLREAHERITASPLRANLSGPVGIYSKFFTQRQAINAAKGLGLTLDLHSTQTADRHRYADLAFQLTQVIGIIEQIATLHRLGSISGVDEYSEGRFAGQKGSSSMPHKTNPISAEQVCGLARIARADLSALLETWRTQWWERDLTNSSVERVAWIDLLHLTGYLVHTAADWSIDENVIDQDAGRLAPWTPERTPFHELNERIVAGENPETVYREIQARRG